MGIYLGIDTSNYTTSAAIYNSKTGEVRNIKKLLPVKEGNKGLRQSDAVFLHTKTMPEIIHNALDNINDISAVGVSAKPRDAEDSYMPCFLAGYSVASSISEVKKCNLYNFSHQRGHIASAIFSSNKFNLFNEKFIAFHVSGGTTDALIIEPDKELIIKCNPATSTLDLNAGQVVDRVGLMLGLSFPCGKELEKFALSADKVIKAKPVLKDGFCCLSGVENKCQALIKNGEKAENIALYVLNFIYETIKLMAEYLLEKHGDLPIVFAGGVMSNSIIREKLSKDFNCYFAEPDFSCDNAVGIAILTAIKEGNFNL